MYEFSLYSVSFLWLPVCFFSRPSISTFHLYSLSLEISPGDFYLFFWQIVYLFLSHSPYIVSYFKPFLYLNVSCVSRRVYTQSLSHWKLYFPILCPPINSFLRFPLLPPFRIFLQLPCRHSCFSCLPSSLPSIISFSIFSPSLPSFLVSTIHLSFDHSSLLSVSSYFSASLTSSIPRYIPLASHSIYPFCISTSWMMNGTKWMNHRVIFTFHHDEWVSDETKTDLFPIILVIGIPWAVIGLGPKGGSGVIGWGFLLGWGTWPAEDECKQGP